ncbi:MAG: hypothetical protein LLG04_08225 [Parachlamydia sp.]|nr:hypothetical protein [Parachlamydia sp.]
MFNNIVLGLQPPTVDNPPATAASRFAMRGELMARPSAHDVKSLERRIGNKINPEYANGKLTPAQEKRIWAISAAAICTILAVGAVIGAFLVAPPLGIAALVIAAVVLTGAAIGSGIFAATREDYNSPARRDEVMQKVAHQSLEQLTREYNREDLVGYALLDRAVVDSRAGTPERAVVYARFQQLSDELKRAESWSGEATGNVRATHATATRVFKNWYDDQRVKIADARRIREQDRENERLRRERDALAGRPDPRNSVGHRVLDGVGAAADALVEMREKQIEQELERLYGANVTPWDRWLQNEEASIHQNYRQNVDALERQFASLKR